jgi:drug/metabolite transporter (DMT)-like permease
MKIPNKPQQWQVGSILGIGVLAVSTSAIFIRLSTEAAGVRGVGFSVFLAALRLIIAAIALLPAWKQLIQTQVSTSAYYYAAGAGLCLAAHFATWISSLSYTSIAASTTIVTTNPIWVSLLSWIWFKDRPTKLTALGIAVALVGGIFIAVADGNIGGNIGNPLLGNSLALVGAWMASLYLILGREAQRSGLNISSYVTVAYSVAAILLLPLPWLFGTGYVGYPTLVYVYVFSMAILSQLIGHTSFNWALRWVSPTLVTLILLFEPISSSLLGFVLFKEVPATLVLVGGLILLVGVAIAVIGGKK